MSTSTFTATVAWQRAGHPFLDKKYPRRHEWAFDGGLRVPASSAPASVPVPLSDPSAIDPEEALVAAASSCHMLWFLALAAAQGFVVDDYTDAAVGHMGPDPSGAVWMQRIDLKPSIRFAGTSQPTAAQIATLHHEAHAKCYIANSIKAQIVIR